MVGSGKGGADNKGRREDGCNDDEIRLTTQWKKEIKYLYKMPCVFEVFLFAAAPLRPMGARDLTSACARLLLHGCTSMLCACTQGHSLSIELRRKHARMSGCGCSRLLEPVKENSAQEAKTGNSLVCARDSDLAQAFPCYQRIV